MAQVTDSFVPQVAPETRIGDDYEHVQARPEQFGGLIAQGKERLAQGEKQLGQGVTTVARFFGDVGADDAATKSMTKADAAANRFRSLRGADALHAQQPTLDEIEAAFKEGREGLTTLEQQAKFDQITRNFQLHYINGVVASHADQESKRYAQNTNNDAANFHLGLIAQNPDNVTVFNDNMYEVVSARVKQAQIEGRDETGVTQAASEGKAEALSARLRSMAVNNPADALRILEKNKDVASVVDKKTGESYYDTLANFFRARADQQNGISAGYGK